MICFIVVDIREFGGYSAICTSRYSFHKHIRYSALLYSGMLSPTDCNHCGQP